MTNERALLSHLFRGYNPSIVPLSNQSEPVEITFDAELIRVMEVVSEYGLIEIHAIYGTATATVIAAKQLKF